jgi:hypothetical protein
MKYYYIDNQYHNCDPHWPDAKFHHLNNHEPTWISDRAIWMGSAILPWSFAQTVKLFSTGRMSQTVDNMTVRECLQVKINRTKNWRRSASQFRRRLRRSTAAVDHAREKK